MDQSEEKEKRSNRSYFTWAVVRASGLLLAWVLFYLYEQEGHDKFVNKLLHRLSPA